METLTKMRIQAKLQTMQNRREKRTSSLCRIFMCLIVLSSVLHIKAQSTTWDDIDYSNEPWVKNASQPYTIHKGLQGRHLALWASHGIFYDINHQRWRWQRPPLFTTCEDLFTQTIVVPYLMPMLEQAGAYVFSPRERDWQKHEVIVDNDQNFNSSLYSELNGHNNWMLAPEGGFLFHEGNYHDDENPFTAGSARMIEATKSKSRQSTVSYQPNVPEAGQYAVYVSYQTVPSSVPDAHYTVWHQGQKTEFLVNQRMGGSTWVYLGTFTFDAGCNEQNRVVLSNQSEHDGMVTTDAVRFGGGMGNIERGGAVSGMPRCLEGARYFAQWAGMPYRVYSTKNGENDYADDINARSMMLNELCGGSVYAPDSVGRKVPIELSLAIHSDAGYNKPDGEGIYGSLTICTTGYGDATLAAGNSRQMSKELASELLDNTTADLQARFGTWNPREVYDRNYSETRLPLVPSAILETLSHQNFNDMRYGLDPNFRFTLARSIYKTILRYISKKHHKEYVVTPLTPQNFSIEFTDEGNGEILISWAPTVDPQEPTATPTAYILYMAEGNGGFDNGMLIHGTAVTTRLRPGALVHFRVAAVNEGGQSFPSQVLSASFRSKECPDVLIVDGFHRLSSPAIRGCGFDLDEDFGVNFGRTCGVLGRQQVFDPSRIGIEDSTGLGYTTSEMAGRFIAGNDFTTVRTHAKAIYQAGNYNIVSCSSEAITNISLSRYSAIDVALGLEYDDGHSLMAYKAFKPEMRTALRQYVAQRGNLLVSGAYTGSDLQTDDEREFLSDVLKCNLTNTYREPNDTIRGMGTKFNFYHHLNEYHYAATTCDVLMPSSPGAFCTLLYSNGTCAAVAYQGNDYRSMTLGIPLECITQSEKRSLIMRAVLNFLLSKS